MAVAIDYTKAASAIILDLINGSQTPNTTLTAAQVTFSAPSENEDNPGTNGNTALTVTGVLAEGYKGTQEVTYNRIAISDVPGTRSIEFEVGSAENVSDLLAAINTRFGINLAAEDITDAALPDVSGGAQNFNLVMAADNLVFTGQTALSLVPNAQEVSTVITTPVLDGLDWTPQ